MLSWADEHLFCWCGVVRQCIGSVSACANTYNHRCPMIVSRAPQANARLF
jgi:hypothetical protein